MKQNLLKKIVISSSLLAIVLSNNVSLAKDNTISSKISINIENHKKFTREEIIEEMVKDGIPREEAEKSTKEHGVGFRATGYGSYYTTETITLNVTSAYKPTLKFYLQMESGHGAVMIKKLNNISMIRDYNSIQKQFQGSIYYNIENYRTIYYEVNGDFYNYGTTTASASTSIGIGEVANVSFGVSNTSSHYKYFYDSGRIYPGR